MSLPGNIIDREHGKFFSSSFGATLRVGSERGIETLDRVHRAIHSGDFFTGGHVFENVPDGASRFILFRADASSEIHCAFSSVTKGDAISYVYEGAETSNDGTPLAMSAHNRRNIKSQESAVFHTPTITDTGLQLNGAQLISGGRGNQAVGSSAELFNNEIILKSNVNYLFEVTNRAGNNSALGLYVSYYIERAI
jgi:hypothetical protein